MMRITIIYIFTLLFFGNIIAQSNINSKTYSIWDNKPSPNSGGDFEKIQHGGYPYDIDWESKSYPIGNGYMGATIFGRTDVERIQITEKTLCNAGMYGLGGLTNFAEIYLDINHKNVKNYKRTLNLNDATSTVTYSYKGVEFNRSSFMSYPDNVLVIKLSANKKGKISFTLRPEIPYLRDSTNENQRSGKIVAQKDLITMAGTINHFSVNYEAQIKVVNDGGNLEAINDGDHGKIKITNANSVYLIVTAGTNYKLEPNLFNENTNNKKLEASINPHDAITSLIRKAYNKGFDNLKETHLNDYQRLFSRVSVNFNSDVPQMPTKKLLDNYKAGIASNYLEELMFQYGRYLLISSSRKGTLPSGLQGVWSQYEVTPWTGGYWHNINVQMNYWGAFSTNLAETFTAYVDYYEAYLPKAEKLATEYISKYNPEALSKDQDDNGWTIGTAAGPYKISAPGGHSGPGTGGFTTKLFWDYYAFTRDTIFLKETAYPAILGMSKFLSKTVKPSKDGSLLAEPSASPEIRIKGATGQFNGDYYATKGSTFDQSFIMENHNDLLKAANVLNINSDFLELVEDQLTKLDPIIIGGSGQIKEFREENLYGEIGDKHHRHISHLCSLYPGTIINSTTPEWLKAASKTLDYRGNNTTGWAMAHRMNSRARTKEGEKAHEVYSKLIKERTLENLWTTHPPFQIDSNFGCMAGVSEMLLQSHEGYIEPLPALPSSWKNGEFNGLVARGNFEVSAKWKNGRASIIEIISRSGGECNFLYKDLKIIKLQNASGEIIPYNRKKSGIISFNTTKGSSYFLSF